MNVIFCFLSWLLQSMFDLVFQGLICKLSCIYSRISFTVVTRYMRLSMDYTLLSIFILHMIFEATSLLTSDAVVNYCTFTYFNDVNVKCYLSPKTLCLLFRSKAKVLREWICALCASVQFCESESVFTDKNSQIQTQRAELCSFKAWTFSASDVLNLIWCGLYL